MIEFAVITFSQTSLLGCHKEHNLHTNFCKIYPSIDTTFNIITQTTATTTTNVHVDRIKINETIFVQPEITPPSFVLSSSGIYPPIAWPAILEIPSYYYKRSQMEQQHTNNNYIGRGPTLEWASIALIILFMRIPPACLPACPYRPQKLIGQLIIETSPVIGWPASSNSVTNTELIPSSPLPAI